MRSMGCERSATSACCRVLRAWKVVLADPNDDIVAVRLDHFDLRRIENMQMAAELREQARLFLAGAARAALELREQPGQQGLAFVGAGVQMARPDSCRASCESALGRRA